MGFSIQMFFNDLLASLRCADCTEEEKLADLMVIIESGHKYAVECGVIVADNQSENAN